MESKRRDKMPVSERAKQFMPFAAVKGLDEALKRKEKEMMPKKELSEEKAAELNLIFSRLKKGSVITAIYYGTGEYIQITGKITMLDVVNRLMRIEDTVVSFDDIRDICISESIYTDFLTKK